MKPAQISSRTLMFATAAALLAPGAVTAQADERPICDALDLAALTADIGVEFDSSSRLGQGSFCSYRVVGDEEQTVRVQLLTSQNFDDSLADLRGTEFVVAGRDAFSDEFDTDGRLVTQVYVDFPPGVISAALWLEEGSVEDQADRTIALAERLVASIEELGMEPALPDPSTPLADAAGFVIPVVDGVAFYDERSLDQGLDELAEMLGVDPSAITSINLDARTCEACSVSGNLGVLQVAGIDAETFEETILSGIDTADVEATDIGGKDVRVLGPGSVIYTTGDTMYALTLDESLLAAVLEALP